MEQRISDKKVTYYIGHKIMSADDKVNSLVKYISSLSDFNIIKPGYPYNHMGATITDAMLQPGLNYKTVVEPRVKELMDKYPEGNTTSGFLKLLQQVTPKILLKWGDSEKPNRILKVADFFVKEGIETEKQLKIWLVNETNIAKLRSVRGIGNKTLDYFKMLSGIQTSAIDRHLINFLNRVGIYVDSYLEAKEVINKTADQIKINRSTLDHSIWKYMSTGKNKDKSCMVH